MTTWKPENETIPIEKAIEVVQKQKGQTALAITPEMLKLAPDWFLDYYGIDREGKEQS